MNKMRKNRLIVWGIIFSFSFCSSLSCCSNEDCSILYRKYIESSDVHESLRYLSRAINCDPNNFEYRIERLKSNLIEKDYKAALKEVDTILLLDTSNYILLVQSSLLIKTESKQEADAKLSQLNSRIKYCKNEMVNISEYDSLYSLVIDYYFNDLNSESYINLCSKSQNQRNNNTDFLLQKEICSMISGGASKDSILFFLSAIN